MTVNDVMWTQGERGEGAEVGQQHNESAIPLARFKCSTASPHSRLLCMNSLPNVWCIVGPHPLRPPDIHVINAPPGLPHSSASVYCQCEYKWGRPNKAGTCVGGSFTPAPGFTGCRLPHSLFRFACTQLSCPVLTLS